MIYAYIPDVPVEPIGGVTTLFDYVERLNEMSGETVATIVSHARYVRRILPRSYPLVPVIYKQPVVTKDDTVIVPEVLVATLNQFPKETKKYLAVLNWQYLEVFSKNISSPLSSLSGILTNSEFTTSKLRKQYPLLPVTHITHVIEPRFRMVTPFKKRAPHSILIMNRKNTHHIDRVLSYLHSTPHRVTLVNHLSPQDLIPLYNQHQIFINLGYPEGFCRPAAEAMACGCVVIGFTGGGGSDFMKHGRNSLIASDGNEDELIAALDHAIHGLTQDHLSDISLVARTSIKQRYTPYAQAHDLYRVFKNILPKNTSLRSIQAQYAKSSSYTRGRKLAYRPLFARTSKEALAVQLYHEREQYKSITSSKFFAIWQEYCRLRDAIREKQHNFLRNG